MVYEHDRQAKGLNPDEKPTTLSHAGRTEHPDGRYLFVLCLYICFTGEMLVKALFEISTLFTLLPLPYYFRTFYPDLTFLINIMILFPAVEESDIIDLEKRYWLLKAQSRTGRFDLETFVPLVSPPIHASLSEGKTLCV